MKEEVEIEKNKQGEIRINNLHFKQAYKGGRWYCCGLDIYDKDLEKAMDQAGDLMLQATALTYKINHMSDGELKELSKEMLE